MSYFALLSIVIGALLCVKWPLTFAFPQWSERLITQRLYTDEKPRWIWLVIPFGLSLIVLTWYMHFSSDVPYSIVLTLIVTVSMLKMAEMVFNYAEFREWLDLAVVEPLRRSSLDSFQVALTVAGMILIALGIYIY
jgi:hypothetical protein